jgi:hypothetical protein
VERNSPMSIDKIRRMTGDESRLEARPKKDATSGLSASANSATGTNTAGQTSSGTRLANVFGISTGY